MQKVKQMSTKVKGHATGMVPHKGAGVVPPTKGAKAGGKVAPRFKAKGGK